MEFSLSSVFDVAAFSEVVDMIRRPGNTLDKMYGTKKCKKKMNLPDSNATPITHEQVSRLVDNDNCVLLV
jgi:ATP-dependent protease HslVU (ClpYQ) ATPase subunit